MIRLFFANAWLRLRDRWRRAEPIGFMGQSWMLKHLFGHEREEDARR